MHGGGGELHQHHIGALMRVGGFRLRNNGLLRLGFRLRFRGLVLGVHVAALESIGPYSMANLIGAHCPVFPHSICKEMSRVSKSLLAITLILDKISTLNCAVSSPE